MKSDDMSKLKAIISKACRYGYLPVFISYLDELLNDNDETLSDLLFTVLSMSCANSFLRPDKLVTES